MAVPAGSEVRLDAITTLIKRVAEASGLAPYIPAVVWRLLAILPQLSGYTLVSVVSLCCDFMVYIMLTGSGWRASLAGAVGYCIGMMTHFCLSTRFVFDTEGMQKSESRLVLEFAASGMAGLAITAFIIALTTELLGLGVLTAKAIAVVASFLAVYFVRRALVFAKPSSQT